MRIIRLQQLMMTMKIVKMIRGGCCSHRAAKVADRVVHLEVAKVVVRVVVHLVVVRVVVLRAVDWLLLRALQRLAASFSMDWLVVMWMLSWLSSILLTSVCLTPRLMVIFTTIPCRLVSSSALSPRSPASAKMIPIVSTIWAAGLPSAGKIKRIMEAFTVSLVMVT